MLSPSPTPSPSLLISLLLLTWLDLSIIILDEPSAKTTRDQPPVAGPPSAITPPLSLKQPQGQGDSGSGLEDDECQEIVRIVEKRRTSRGDEYKVRWKSTWLPGSELRSAQRLVFCTGV